jgi:F-type H+-transporting ATPase subunit a
MRRTATASLILFMLTLGSLYAAEGAHGSAGSEESFNLSTALFAELTDNFDQPYATFDIAIGSLRFPVKITKHFILIGVVGLLVLASMFYLARKLKDPFKKPTRLQSLFESLIQYMSDTVYQPVLGTEGRRFYLLCFSIFLFLLYSNLLGMIPPFARLRPAGASEAVWLGGAVTGNLATTAGLGIITFVVLNVAGMRSKGIVGYWKDLVPHGTPGWMAPFTLLFEVVGIFSKTIALIMRLFANMIGGHVAILLILLLILKFQSLAIGPVAVLVDLAISALELFVAVLQAYIFSFLSAMFIGLAIRKHS